MVAEIAVGDKTYPVACNAFTPIVFSREFSVTRADGSKRPKDINEDVSMILDVTANSSVAPVVPLLEIFYACAKTASAKLDSFDEWVKAFPADAYDLERADGWAADVMGIVSENFFPHAGKDVEPATGEASDAAVAAGAGK
jgi:hypothetical protein